MANIVANLDSLVERAAKGARHRTVGHARRDAARYQMATTFARSTRYFSAASAAAAARRSACRVEYDPFRGQRHTYRSLARKDGQSARCRFSRRAKRGPCEIIGKAFVVGDQESRPHWILDISQLGLEAVDG